MIRKLLCVCCVMQVLITGSSYAQDQSAIWNAAKRVRLGLDGTIVKPSISPSVQNPAEDTPNTPDVAVFNPSANAQSENSIGVNPANPNQLMVSTNGRIPGSNPVVHQTWAFSSNGGTTWPNQSEDLPPGILDSFGDPVAFFDVGGKAYYNTLGSPGGLYFVTTTDLGVTWSARANADLLNSTNDDKQHATADHSGTFPNNVYIAWTDFGVSGTPIQFARSTDRGVTWGARTTLAIGANRGQGVHISTGPNGEVYVMWAHYTTGTAEVGIGMAKSTDGGATFSTPAIVYPINGIRISNGGIPALNNVRAASFPYFDADRSNGPRRGWVYAVTPELVNSQADIFLRRSTDGGTTWSAPIQVNDADVQTGKWQFMASIAVDQISGEISVAYYSMDSVGTNFMTNRYMAHSIDGGNTWERFVISDVRANWQPQGTPNTNTTYNGDYNETAAWGGKAWAIWTDRRTGTNKAYVERIVYADPGDPNAPTNVSAFSDFSTPTSMLLRWSKPTTLVNGDPIGPFVIRIRRNGVQITERPSTDSSFTDTGLTDGTLYNYSFFTRLTANDSLSPEVQISWVAGGSRIPNVPTNLAVTGNSTSGYKVKWRNPSRQIDGTRLDDLAGIRVYRDGSLITTLARTSADTAKLDSTTNTPPAGFHTYYVTAIDNEAPVNESGQSNTGSTPLDLPMNDQFAVLGAPNTNLWLATNVDVNDLGLNEPSAPNSLNLNGSPTSNSDNIESRPIDLTGRQGAGVALAYLYQPGGTSDRPEVADSLIVEFQNNLGQWVTARKYPGIASTTPIPDYAFEAIGIDGVDPAGGTFFFNGFKFRFRSRGAAGTSDDDWFVDDVFFGIPSGTANIGASSVVAPSGQVSNNVALNPVIRVLNASAVQAGPFTVNVNITGPGATYNASQADSNLPAGAARNVTLSTPFTPNAVGQWTVKAWTRLTGDPNPNNDTTTSTFFSVSPLTLPVQETFADSGAPNPLTWTNRNARVNADGNEEPSAPYALNLAGNTTGLGLDTLTSLTTNLSGRAGQGVRLAYWQQPQGTGDVPEAADSLVVEALNDQGGWVVLRKHPGAANRLFQFEGINLDSVSALGGTFFHGGFKFRFRSRATTVTTTRQDDWFVDDVFLGIPNTVPQMVVSPQDIADTVLVGTIDSTSYPFVIRNNNPFGTFLNYTIAESPVVTWLSELPASGSLNGGLSATVRAAINFTSVTPGTYTTRLLVSGNDPGNTVDTVNVRFLVNAAPSIRTTPDSFFYSRNRGDSVTATFKVRNIGLGPLTYNTTVSGGYAGQTAEDIGNTENNLTTTSNLMRGGVVGVTTSVQLLEIKSYLNITTPVELRFVVYENTVQTGTFTKIFENTVLNAGPGTQFYSSGPVNIVLQAGKYYAVGVNWNGGLNYFWDASAPVPIPLTFGTITGGLALTVFPPPATITQGALTSLYYTQLVTARDRWLTVTTNGSGNVAPGDSATVGFKIRTNQLGGGTALAALLVNNNDPLRPVVSVPVRLDVITGITEENSGIPETYELGQNYPNPFNPSTTIRFALPQESTVKLAIYNILGQEIVTLADEVRAAGYFVATWDGTNTLGNKVSSGVYFYRMEATGTSNAESFKSLKKMIILK